MNNNNYGNHTTSKINIKIENNIKKKKKKHWFMIIKARTWNTIMMSKVMQHKKSREKIIIIYPICKKCFL